MTELKIKTEFIRLDAALKLCNAVNSGGHAKIVIQDGFVKVNNEVCLMRGKKLRDGDIFSFEGSSYLIKNAN